MGRSIGFLAIVGLCLGIAFPAFASQRIALVIGNSDYENAPLANPVRDAALMAETLRSVGFDVLEYNDLDRRDLTKAFLAFGRKLEEAGKEATALVYYAGHGAQVNGENYLIPVGARIEEEIDVEIEGVRASSLLRTLRKAKSTLNIVILDACRNNPFESGSRSAQTGLAKMDAPTGTLLAYSTAPGKVAEDGNGKNSTYTKALARAIKTPGAKVEEVFKTVRVNVVDRTQGRQVPWESSSLTGDFIFQEKLPEPEPVVTASTSAVDTTQIEIEYWKSIATSTDPALFEAYMAEYPDGVFKSIAEQRVASLNAALVQPQQDDGFAREQAVWNSIKDSGSIGMLNGFLESYPDGIYATIARATIANLESRQQLASRTTQPVDEEFVIWDSVKNAGTAAELQVYLDAYPQGKYAKLARAKVAALNTTAVSSSAAETSAVIVSTPANPDFPFDGTWRIVGEPTAFIRSWRYGVCRNGDEIDDTITVEGGEIRGRVTSKTENTLSIQGQISPNGRLSLDFITGEGQQQTGRGEYRSSLDAVTESIPMKIKLESGHGAGCRYELTMTRAAETSSSVRQQVASVNTTEIVDDEALIWDSVKNAGTAVELQVYLDAYPNGRFAAVANAKIAALTTTATKLGSGNRYQGAWRFELTYIRSIGATLPTAFCKAGAKIDTEVDIDAAGKFNKAASSNKGTRQTVSGNVTTDGSMLLTLQSWAGARGPSGEVELPIPDGTLSDPVKFSAAYSECHYTLKLTRVE